MATDACRSVLPAALLTNVGVTVNARNLSHMISKLLSSPLIEERELGGRLLQEGNRTTPTLLKHAQASEHLRGRMFQESWQAAHRRGTDWGEAARLVDHDGDAADRIAEAILYRQIATGAREIREHVRGMERTEKLEIIDRRMRDLGDHDAVIREFELAQITLELLLDYGAYREFRRHRMQSCFPQPMTIGLGYRAPSLISRAGLGKKFREAMEIAERGCEKVAEARMSAAPYLVTHAHQRAVLARMDLREAYHVFKLRTSQLAHESLREPMLEAMRQVVEVEPDLFRWLRLRDYPEWWPHAHGAE